MNQQTLSRVLKSNISEKLRNNTPKFNDRDLLQSNYVAQFTVPVGVTDYIEAFAGTDWLITFNGRWIRIKNISVDGWINGPAGDEQLLDRVMMRMQPLDCDNGLLNLPTGLTQGIAPPPAGAAFSNVFCLNHYDEYETSVICNGFRVVGIHARLFRAVVAGAGANMRIGVKFLYWEL
jgi:hypothetical protein